MINFTLSFRTHKRDLKVTVVIFSGHYAAVIKRSIEYFMKNVKVPNKILTYFENKRGYSSYSPKKINS